MEIKLYDAEGTIAHKLGIPDDRVIVIRDGIEELFKSIFKKKGVYILDITPIMIDGAKLADTPAELLFTTHLITLGLMSRGGPASQILR